MMAIDTATRRTIFRNLHSAGCFVLPNPWDLGSVRRLEQQGFKALASTSSGFAWSMGREDNTMTRDEVLGNLRMICSATDLPVNADFEAGFSDDAEGVRTNVGLAIETGIAGLSIEDRIGDDLYDLNRATERIRAARKAIDDSSEDVVLVGRCEGLLVGKTDVLATIDRIVAYAEAGADCLYAPGIRSAADIAALVRAVAPKPVNVLLLGPDMKVRELAELGVRRVSTGGGLARVAWAGFDSAVRMLIDEGRLPAREKRF
jgi:2-methylisocitrate lyase-like PEP mutase family enzyme